MANKLPLIVENENCAECSKYLVTLKGCAECEQIFHQGKIQQRDLDQKVVDAREANFDLIRLSKRLEAREVRRIDDNILLDMVDDA